MNPPCRETWALYTTKLHDSQLFSPQSNTAWWKYSRLERKNDFTRFRGMGELRLFVDKRGDGPSHHVSQGYPLLGRLGFKLLVKFRGKFNRQRQGNVYLNIGNGIGRWCRLRGWHLNHHLVQSAVASMGETVFLEDSTMLLRQWENLSGIPFWDIHWRTVRSETPQANAILE